MLLDLGNLREDYNKGKLGQFGISADPIAQFKIWFDKAKDAGIQEPNAMTLATCTSDGKPSARVVLLKGIEEEGFIFYTNYQSRKAVELGVNPYAALVFLWLPLHQQIRIEGQRIKNFRRTINQVFPKPTQGQPDRRLGFTTKSSHFGSNYIWRKQVEELNQLYKRGIDSAKAGTLGWAIC